MRRENMQFLPEREEKQKPNGVREQAFIWVLKQKDGAVLGEFYRAFPNTAQRTVRQVVSELKNSKKLKTKPCRCHGSSIYYGIKKLK